MRVIFSPEARTEFNEAVQYYDQQRQGLGDELRAEIRGFLPRLQRSPLTFPVERGDIRRLILARFPYIVSVLNTGMDGKVRHPARNQT